MTDLLTNMAETRGVVFGPVQADPYPWPFDGSFSPVWEQDRCCCSCRCRCWPLSRVR